MNRQYDRIHKPAKFIVFIIVLGLTEYITEDHRLISGLIVFLWFWGTNTVAYIIEHVLNCKHKHGWF